MAKDILKSERKKKDTDKYIGRVVNVEDSERLLRMQIRVQGKHTDDIQDQDLPWCEYALPPGNRYNEGTFMPVKPGDYVWVDFPYKGDARRVRLLGSVHYCPEKVPNFPHEAWNGPDALEHKRVSFEPMPEEREYGKNVVFSEKGVVIEIVEDSIIVTQKKTGTAIEITPDGDITLHSEKNILMSAQESIQMWAKHGISIACEMGDISITALRSSISVSALQDISVVAGNTTLLAGGSGSILLGDGGGQCHGDFNFDGNINADGSIIDAAGNTNHHSHGDGV